MQQHYQKDFAYEQAAFFGPAKIWRFKAGKMTTTSTWTCSPNDADSVSALYPSKENEWTLHDLVPAKEKKKSLLSSISRLWSPGSDELPLDFDSFGMPWCPHCNARSGEVTKFTSTSSLPTMSHYGALRVDPRQFPNFYIDLAVNGKPAENNQVLVELNLNGAHPRKFSIPLNLDNKMHHYEFALKSLSLGSDEMITELNVHPVYQPVTGNGASFNLKDLGFAHNRTDK